MSEAREIRVGIFNDTKRLYETSEVLKEAVENSIANQQLILEGDRVDFVLPPVEELKVGVTKERSFEAAMRLKNKGYKSVCVHNFASATNPGGGVLKGSSAQEECLCRVSTLYPCLSTQDMFNGFYVVHRTTGDALHNDDCIYTPDVVVFKTDTATPKLMPEEEWVKVNVITCSAPNLREHKRNQMNPDERNIDIKITDKEQYDIHVKRLQRILDIAYAKGNDAIVLGAFGCGAFQNNPRIVVRAAKDVLKNNRGRFMEIVFAVYCPPQDDTNYQVFSSLESMR